MKTNTDHSRAKNPRDSVLKGTTEALQILQICSEVMRSSFELNQNKTVVIEKKKLQFRI